MVLIDWANINNIHDTTIGMQDNRETALRPNLSIKGPAMRDPIGNVIVTRLAIKQKRRSSK